MKKYRDEIAMVCHDMMKAGQSIGAVSDAEMRKFEENAVVSEPEPVQEAPEPGHPATA
ncbi:MAG: hypothetical protein LBB78_07980 [Spirochaetaceae bacterium]|jgi:hypothetical protein|nr:hypothetical protein [Spirochaetaceae bacterium]